MPIAVSLLVLMLTGTFPGAGPEPGDAVPETALMQILAAELEASMGGLVNDDGVKPYYLAYSVTDTASVSITGELGALQADLESRRRILDVDVRVGDYTLDNTRNLRGGGGRGGGAFGRGGASAVPLDDSPAAIRHVLWRSTDQAFRAAVSQFDRVLTDQKTAVEEGVSANDFSREDPSHHVGAEVGLKIDAEEWRGRIRTVSQLALEFPTIQNSSVSLVGTAENRTMVSSEGTRLRTGRELWRVVVSAGSRADDGMDLSQSFIFNAADEGGLPSVEQMQTAFREVIDMVLALRGAPLVEPYTGPAILINRASAVFFHEIFGHRIEGHRQKSVDEGQTFTKMVGQPILPEFLSVIDDPTLASFGGEDLRGFYEFDDEGIRGSRVELVKEGVL